MFAKDAEGTYSDVVVTLSKLSAFIVYKPGYDSAVGERSEQISGNSSASALDMAGGFYSARCL